MNFLYREVTDVAKSYEKQQKLAVSLGGGGGGSAFFVKTVVKRKKKKKTHHHIWLAFTVLSRSLISNFIFNSNI